MFFESIEKVIAKDMRNQLHRYCDFLTNNVNLSRPQSL